MCDGGALRIDPVLCNVKILQVEVTRTTEMRAVCFFQSRG